jgi:hypothetical protein
VPEFYRNENDIRFVLWQHRSSSLKKQCAVRHIAPLGHIILIPSQPVFAPLDYWSYIFCIADIAEWSMVLLDIKLREWWCSVSMVSSWPPAVCRKAHVLFTLFMFTHSGVQHILCCVFVCLSSLAYINLFSHNGIQAHTIDTLHHHSRTPTVLLVYTVNSDKSFGSDRGKKTSM